MKTKILLILVLLCTTIFSSCKKDKEPTFDYPLEMLHGIWEGSEILFDDGWVDITKYPNTIFKFSIRFNSDGTYSSSGYFGDGSGTYKAIDKTITTYIDGEEYKYIIKSLTKDECEATMDTGSTSTLDVRVKKK